MSGIIHVRDAQGTVRRLLDGCETAKREIRRVYGLVDQLHAVAIQADAEHESAVEVLRSVNRGHRRVA